MNPAKKHCLYKCKYCPICSEFPPLQKLLFQLGKSLLLYPQVLLLMGTQGEAEGRTSIIKQIQGLFSESSRAVLPFFLGIELKVVCAHANKTNRWVRKKHVCAPCSRRSWLCIPHAAVGLEIYFQLSSLSGKDSSQAAHPAALLDFLIMASVLIN